MDQVDYELKYPIDYSFEGQQAKASYVTLKCPGYKHASNFMPIKQAFVKAAMSMDTGDVDESKSEGGALTAEHAMMALMTWDGDVSKLFIHATELYRSGLALIDGEVVLTKTLVEKMHISDIEGLLGTLAANFIMPSLGIETNT